LVIGTPRPANIGTVPIKGDRSVIRATARPENSRPIYSSNSKSLELWLSPELKWLRPKIQSLEIKDKQHRKSETIAPCVSARALQRLIAI